MEGQRPGKLIASGRSREFSSTDIVETTHGHAINTRLERFDPFDDEFLISLDDLLAMEESGVAPGERTTEKQEHASLSQIVVRRALNRLPKFEREVITRYYFQGETCKDISVALSQPEITVNNARLKAIGQLKKLVVEEKRQAGITSDFNRCLICNHERVKELDEFIHLWLDSHNWNFQGLTANLNNRFGFTVSKDDIELHTTYHLGVSDDKSILSSLTKYDDKHIVQLNVTITPDLDAAFEKLAADYNTQKSLLVRLSVRYGLRWLRMMLALNEEMFVEQLRLTQFMRKVSL